MEFISPRRLKELGMLGMNRRNVSVIGKWNQRKNYPLVDNKLKTKLISQQYGMAVPELIGTISHQFEVKNLRKRLGLARQFVIKPAQGSGGKGILVIMGRKKGRYIKPSGVELSIRDAERHVSNILSGLYSLGGRNDVAMIESRVKFDEAMSCYSYEGVPDIRVVVYRGYPVMAMMRCSTHSSDGKANLHQGAVGVGIDIGDGHSLFAVQNGLLVDRHPDTQHSFIDLQVPHWPEILRLAAGCFEMTGLGYLGTDVVIDRERGPLILELNARPGLAIQIANQRGLAQRLALIDSVVGKHPSIEARIEFSRQSFGSAEQGMLKSS
jgi:alpha-L-glutamate ligase-like protein